MRSGGSCGTCHNGKAAFGVTDSSACQTCHAGSREAALAADPGTPGAARSVPGRKLPRDLTFNRGEPSPGLVTFRHASHVTASTTCAACHPAPFAMKASGGKPGGAMHEHGACGGCHDGKRAFSDEDPAACERCHAATKGTP
jgi:c(7)-type cytochrome triheme protein